MGFLESTYRRFADLAGGRLKARIARMLMYSGVEADVDIWLGSRLLVAFLFALAAALLPWTVLKYYNIFELTGENIATAAALPALYASLGGALLVFLFVLFLFYMHIFYIIEDRTNRIEDVMPDFLMLVAANLNAGMPVFQAFTYAARPEFGPLEEEVKKAAIRASSTESLSQALIRLSEAVDSPLFRRTIALLERGIRSGGSLAKLLETTSAELRRTQEMSRELQASTRTYALFLGFIMIILMPVLFAVSIQFLDMFISISSTYAPQQGAFNIPIFSGKVGVTVDFIIIVSYVMMVICSLLTSALIGVIYEGKQLYGLKYFPVITMLSFAVFFIGRMAFEQIIAPFA